MNIRIMDPTDRTGRGGDHTPFATRGFPAIRFTSTHENGNASPTGGNQHTTRDLIREEGTGRYLVNFGYLARNSVINAMGLIGGALGPQVPDFSLSEPQPQRYIRVTVTSPTSPVGVYKVAVRTSGSNDFAVVYTLRDSLNFTVPGTQAGTTYYIALAAVDGNGAQSLYSQEKSITASVNGPVPIAAREKSPRAPELRAPRILPDRITFEILRLPAKPGRASLEITDAQGKTVGVHTFMPVGTAYEVTLDRKRLAPGIYEVLLKSGSKSLGSRRLVLTGK
jgi:hypothetical protein